MSKIGNLFEEDDQSSVNGISSSLREILNGLMTQVDIPPPPISPRPPSKDEGSSHTITHLLHLIIKAPPLPNSQCQQHVIELRERMRDWMLKRLRQIARNHYKQYLELSQDHLESDLNYAFMLLIQRITAADKPVSIESRDNFRKLFTTIAFLILVSQRRHEARQPKTGGGDPVVEFDPSNPNPEDFEDAFEVLLAALLKNLNDPVDRRIVTLRLEGKSWGEIQNQLLREFPNKPMYHAIFVKRRERIERQLRGLCGFED